jgi:transposase
MGGWEGYAVREDWQEWRDGKSWWVIRLEPIRGIRRRCSGCKSDTTAVHDIEERRVRDLPSFEHCIELIAPRVRVACPGCGPKLEQLHWLAAYVRVTSRLADSVARLCQVASVRHVAQFFDLDWKTVKELDRRSLDLFHVIAKYGREVIDLVRVDRANELRADRDHRRLIKGARWLLLKNRDSLRPGEDVELEELLAANRPLFVVYVLRDAQRLRRASLAELVPQGHA